MPPRANRILGRGLNETQKALSERAWVRVGMKSAEFFIQPFSEYRNGLHRSYQLHKSGFVSRTVANLLDDSRRNMHCAGACAVWS